MAISKKTWSDGEKVFADDLNGNFDTLIEMAEKQFTADGDISENDVVYISAADTIKKMGASDIQDLSTVATNTDNFNGGSLSLPMATVGRFLHLNGGNKANSADLYGQVRTLDADEEDLTVGSSSGIFTTNNGTRCFDACKIDDDKFIVIYQKDSGGSPNGIAAKVLTVSGTTISQGSESVIETTGSVQEWCAIVQIGTDKALAFYRADSDGDLYCMVLSISGTTITQNTAVKVKAMSSAVRVTADRIADDSAIAVYQDGSGNIFGVTISVSSTTPTINTEQTILTVASATEHYLAVKVIDSGSALFAYSQSGSPVNDQISKLTISGATITKGSDLSVGASRITVKYGIEVIGTDRALICTYDSGTLAKVRLLDISGATPTELQSKSLSFSTVSSHFMTSICKISPWIYSVMGSSQNNLDRMVFLIPDSTAHLGMAAADIADAADGDVYLRSNLHELSGVTLTPGSQYYVDDNGSISKGTSSLAPQFGIATSTTDLLIQ